MNSLQRALIRKCSWHWSDNIPGHGRGQFEFNTKHWQVWTLNSRGTCVTNRTAAGIFYTLIIIRIKEVYALYKWACHWLTFFFQGEHVTFEDCLAKVDRRAPFIAGFGLTFDGLTDFKVVIENENVLTMPSLEIAVKCCFAAYFVYNISYPPDLTPFLLFMEYVFNLKATKKLPLSVSIMIESLEKL